MKTNSMRLTAIILSLSTLILFNCELEKKSAPTMDYQFDDQEKLLTCSEMDTLLINEALYSFRDDITNHYTFDQNNLPLSYRNFVNDAVNNRADYQNIVSEHTKQVFKALKQTPGIWRAKGDGYILDYDGPLFACIADNISDQGLKKTIDALLTTNSMSSRMLNEPLRQNTFKMRDDAYLAALVAFDLYYAKLFDVDLSQPANNPADSPVEADDGSHEGHNH